MKGDKIVVSNSTMMGSPEDVFPVYKLRTNPDGTYMVGYDGGVVLDRNGGVKAGSTGTVESDALMVQKSQLLQLLNQPASLGGTQDKVAIFSVFFDKYQLSGWISADHIRIVQGGAVPTQKR